MSLAERETTTDSGWMSIAAPGMDVLTLPRGRAGQISPTVTLRWTDSGSTAQEPWSRCLPGGILPGEPGGPDPEAVWPVSADRWEGRHLVGWRQVRLVRSASGRGVVAIRWLHEPVDSAPAPTHGSARLEAVATVGLHQYATVEPVLDGMVSEIRADWKPQRAAPPRPMAATPPTETAGAASADGAAPASFLPGVPLHRLEPEELACLLHRHDAGPMGSVPAGTRKLAAGILRAPDETHVLTRTDAGGRHGVLSLSVKHGMVLVTLPERPEDPAGPDSAVWLGLLSTERAAELVFRTAGWGPSDTRRLDHDTFPARQLVRRMADPGLPLPADVVSDDRWRDLWGRSWTGWTVESQRLEQGATDRLDVLTVGGTEQFAITRDGQPDGQSRVRLKPVSTASLFTTLLARMVPQPGVESSKEPTETTGSRP